MTSGERTRTRLDPEVRREQIVEAAERVFAGREPADVTFEQIAEAAGVSRGLVYNYFGDKGGLIAAVYLRTFRRIDDELSAAAAASDASPSERLRQIIDSYLRFARENSAAWKLIGTAEATVHPAVQAARRERYEQMALSWGGSDQARMIARGMVGMLEAATLDWLENPDSDLEVAATVLHAMLWTGLSGLDEYGVDFRGVDPQAVSSAG